MYVFVDGAQLRLFNKQQIVIIQWHRIVNIWTYGIQQWGTSSNSNIEMQQCLL